LGPLNLIETLSGIDSRSGGKKLLSAALIDLTPVTDLDHDYDKLFAPNLINDPASSLTHTMARL